MWCAAGNDTGVVWEQQILGDRNTGLCRRALSEDNQVRFFEKTAPVSACILCQRCSIFWATGEKMT